MYHYTVWMQSLCPFQFSRPVRAKLREESDVDYDTAVMRDRAHYTAEGFATIPQRHFKKALELSPSYLNEKLKGGRTLTKYFKSALACTQGIVLPYTRTDIPLLSVTVITKEGYMVTSTHPTIEKWEGSTEWLIYDDLLTQDLLLRHFRAAGIYVGVGKWRVGNGGEYGRFGIVDIQGEQLGL
jgi:hypothetical protein